MSASPDYAVGFKLIPDWPLPHFMAAMNLTYSGHLNKAKELLQEGLIFDSTSWLALYAQAIVEWGDKNWNAAVMHLQQCLKLNPDIPNLHYTLAIALQAQDNLKEAREEYRMYLRQNEYPQFAEKAREALASINETLSKIPEHNQ